MSTVVYPLIGDCVSGSIDTQVSLQIVDPRFDVVGAWRIDSEGHLDNQQETTILAGVVPPVISVMVELVTSEPLANMRISCTLELNKITGSEKATIT